MAIKEDLEYSISILAGIDPKTNKLEYRYQIYNEKIDNEPISCETVEDVVETILADLEEARKEWLTSDKRDGTLQYIRINNPGGITTYAPNSISLEVFTNHAGGGFLERPLSGQELEALYLELHLALHKQKND